jgi:hypothetical protein
VGYQGVRFWWFLFYCDMSSMDRRLQKSQEFWPEKNKNWSPDDFRQKKERLNSPIVQLSYGGKNKSPTARPRPSIDQLNKFSKGTALTGWSRVKEGPPTHYMPIISISQ